MEIVLDRAEDGVASCEIVLAWICVISPPPASLLEVS